MNTGSSSHTGVAPRRSRPGCTARKSRCCYGRRYSDSPRPRNRLQRLTLEFGEMLGSRRLSSGDAGSKSQREPVGGVYISLCVSPFDAPRHRCSSSVCAERLIDAVICLGEIIDSIAGGAPGPAPPLSGIDCSLGGLVSPSYPIGKPLPYPRVSIPQTLALKLRSLIRTSIL
jgi:hypothetical protein